MTTNNPIRVGGQPLPDSVLQGTIRSPIVPSDNSSSNLLNIGGGLGSTTRRSQLYKVKLTSNGKVFNMLLPPSIETKHPGKSNPMQMPGLQIEASAAISKLKIPGFFPIYQHLGVETLTVSMSGMFTGYDGTDIISTASEWEGWKDLTIKEGQDSYSAANELYEFAVRNKSLIEVIIYTSDGSFIPKKSTATTFRDEQSNIRFKGYIKDFKQIYVRQDRNYYMLKFEIIDLTTGTNTCKSAVRPDVGGLLSNAQINTNTFGKKIDNLTTQEVRDIQKVLNKKGLYTGPIDGQNTAAFQSVINSLKGQFKLDVNSNGIYTGVSQSDTNSPNKNSTDLARLLDVIIDNPTNNTINDNTNNKIPTPPTIIKGSVVEQLNTARLFLNVNGSTLPQFYNTVINKDLQPTINDLKPYSSNIINIQNRQDISGNTKITYIGNKTLNNAEYGLFNIGDSLYYAVLEEINKEKKVKFILNK